MVGVGYEAAVGKGNLQVICELRRELAQEFNSSVLGDLPSTVLLNGPTATRARFCRFSHCLFALLLL